MMKVGLFNTTVAGLERYKWVADRYPEDIELMAFECSLTVENMHLITENGIEALIYFAPFMQDEEYFGKLAEAGVKYVSCSSAGYDHYNIPAMKKVGIKGSNVPVYSPNAIAEHAVLMTLSALRHYRKQLLRIENCNYELPGLMGREIRNMTIGVVGTGRIGATTIQCLTGFGPKKMYGCDPYPNKSLEGVIEYVDIDTLYKECDVVIYHCMYNQQNHHMVNAETLAKMKDGVVLINAARGGLFDTKAIIEAVKSGKIGALGIDVIENEMVLRDAGDKLDYCPNEDLAELLKYENVTFTRHTAFYTDEAYRNMSEICIDNLVQYARNGECERELVK